MRELPEDLSSSLKSYRGSIYGRNGDKTRRDVDLEKGEAQRPSDSLDEDETAAGLDENDDSSTRKPDRAMNGSNGVLKNPQNPGRQKPSRKPGTRRAPSSDQAAKKSGPQDMTVFHAPPVEDPDPAAERLAEDESPLSDDDFHQLMGMRRPSSAEQRREEGNYPFKLATKHGLYRECSHTGFDLCFHRLTRPQAPFARRCNISRPSIASLMSWHTYSLPCKHPQSPPKIPVCLFIPTLDLRQTIIGAIFIVLGALRDPRTYLAISILGAISTAVGGALALMKGQGLPNRLRQARDQMRNVVFEAEELYWDFRSGRPIIYSDIKKIREDYLRVMEEMRKNHPDTWTNAASQAMEPRRRGRGRR